MEGEEGKEGKEGEGGVVNSTHRLTVSESPIMQRCRFGRVIATVGKNQGGVSVLVMCNEKCHRNEKENDSRPHGDEKEKLKTLAIESSLFS